MDTRRVGRVVCHCPPKRGNSTSRGRETHFKQVDPANPDDLRWLSFFPDEQTVQYSTLGLEVEVTMRGMLPPRPTKNGVIFESADGRARGIVLNSGHAAFEVQPFPTQEPLESPTGIPNAQEAHIIEPAASSLPRASGGEIRASAEPVADTRTEQDKNRVRITGRVGADPHFRESGKSGLIVNFPLAEHVEGQEQPTWHKVYTTGDRARRLQEKPIVKGQEVRVDGYRQERERQTRDGKTETVVSVYAAHIRPYKHGGSDSAQPEGTTDADQHAAESRHGDAGSQTI